MMLLKKLIALSFSEKKKNHVESGEKTKLD